METLTEGGNLHRPSNEVWDGIVPAGPGAVLLPTGAPLPGLGVQLLGDDEDECCQDDVRLSIFL